MKKSISLMCILIVMLTVLPVITTVSAAENSSITLYYNPGVCTFRFYKIANISREGQLALTSEFADYTGSVSLLNRLGELDTDEMRTLSTTLEAVILRDGLQPSFTSATDSNGVVVKSNSERGVYLILGEQTKDEQYVYTPAPLLISIPTLLENGTEQNHIVVEHTKIQKDEIVNKTTQYKVRKIWKDTKNQALRPESIAVQLMRNDIVYDTVLLNAANNWSYQWTELSTDYTWTAVEKDVPASYSLSVEKEQSGIILINSYDGPPPPPEQEIPPTGQLWWPVPILFVLGIALLVLGLTSTHKEKL